MASHQIVPNTQELLLFALSLILSPLLVTAADQVSISTSCAASLIVVATVALLLVAAYIVYYIRRYGNGFLGVATVDRRDPTAEKGLRPAAVEALPKVRFSEIKTRKSGDVELECAVCLIEFQDPEILRLLPECCHVFHSDCIEPWLAAHVTCPICRADLGKLKPSSPSKSRILDRISRGVSEPFDHHQHLTVQIDASLQSGATNTGIPRGVDGSVRSHATGEQVVQAAEDSNARTLLPKELCPKSDYRESVRKSKSWNCFSTALTVDNSIHILIGPTN